MQAIKMKRILVPTDFSDCAMSALKVAAKIAEKTKSTISLVHTYELPLYGFTSGQLMYDGEQIGKIKQDIKVELQKIAHMHFIKKVKVEQFLLPDYSLDHIVDHDILKKSDLIVMGTHGASGWSKDLIGSNTERIIRRAKCPVLTVREDKGNKFNPSNVVFASSFYGEVYEQFPLIKTFADLFGAKIHLLRVNTPTDFMTTPLSERIIKEFKDKFKLKDATMNIFNDLTVEDGVINFAQRIKADLIAMETHGRTGVNHIINGSIAEEVANNSGIPILTFRIKHPPPPAGVIFPEI